MTASESAHAAELACRAVGLDGSDAALIRLGHNAIYRLGALPVVVRVARPADEWPRAQREVCVARWLADLGVPAVRLWDSSPQPIEALDRPVTFWEALSPSGQDTDARDLAELLAALHSVSSLPPCDLRPFDPLATAELRARKATNVPDDLTAALLERCDVLRAAYRSLSFALPGGAIHGDAYLGNVLRRDSQPVLIDFETVTDGPREWDLIPTAIAHRRFGLPASEWRSFVDTYGFDIESWPGFDVLASIREVMTASWLMQLVDDRPGAMDEVRARIQSMTEGERDRRWQAF